METREKLIGSFVSTAAGHARLSGQLAADMEAAGFEADVYEALAAILESGARVGYCDLASRLVLTASGLTRRIDRLVRLGYAKRETSEKDRRSGFAVITDEGRAAYERMRPVYEESVMRHFGSKITEGEARQLEAIMNRIIKGLDKLHTEG